jgi:hypothetical protein
VYNASVLLHEENGTKGKRMCRRKQTRRSLAPQNSPRLIHRFRVLLFV